MSDNAIGVHVFSLRFRKKRTSAHLKIDRSVHGQLIRKGVDNFLSVFKNPMDAESKLARPWFIESEYRNGNAVSGIIQYGSTGYESEIRDGKTRDFKYQRETTDLDVIPIYYRFWVPEEGDFGLFAIQTLGQRSCVRRVQKALEFAFRRGTDQHVLEQLAVQLTELGAYKKADVKTLTFVQREVSSDDAQNAILGDNRMLNVNWSMKALPRESLGTLGNIMPRIMKQKKDDAIDISGSSYSEAVASVKVGKRTRKVVLVGISKNSGKIDLTDDVERELNGHPKFDSIDKEVRDIFKDIVAN